MSFIHKKICGFTLLEILIALFIFTIVAIITVSTIHLITGSQAEVEKKNKKMQSLQIAILLLSRDTEQTIDRGIINANDIQEAALVGTTKSVTFTHTGLANPKAKLRRATLQRTRYRFSGTSFYKDTWDVLDQAPQSQPNSLLLLSDVLSIQFSYLNQQNTFQNEWPTSAKGGLPKAVRISISLKDWGKLTQLMVIPVETVDSH